MAKKAAGIFGIAFLLMGVVGLFLPGGMGMEADPARAPHLFGLFPVNLLHNIVHLLFGLWGLAAARTWAGARSYGRIGSVIYVVLAVLGFVAPNGFGLVPLGGHDIWLHLVLAGGLAWIGFSGPATDPDIHATTATTA